MAGFPTRHARYVPLLQPGQLPTRVAALIIFITLATALVVPHMLGAGYFTLTLLALVWLTRHQAWRGGDLSPLELVLIVTVLLFVGIWTLSWAAHGFSEQGARGAGRIWRLLPIVPVYLMLRRMQGLDQAFWNGLIAGGIIAGGYALWFVITGQTGAHVIGEFEFRVEGTTNPIYFGGIALAFALMLVPRVIDDNQPVTVRMLALVAIVFAFAANALSGSRGAWLAVPILIVIYFYTLGTRQSPAWRIGTPVALLLLSLMALTAPMMPMHERLAETWTELHLIGQGTESDGTIGLRLQMWTVAVNLFADHPWLGAGPGSYQAALHQAVAAHGWDPVMLRYRHPHNEYLSALTNAGIPGLASFVLMIAVIATRFARRLGASYGQTRFLAWSGLAAITTLAVMALSESIFERNTGVMWFGLLTALMAALLAARIRSQSARPD